MFDKQSVRPDAELLYAYEVGIADVLAMIPVVMLPGRYLGSAAG